LHLEKRFKMINKNIEHRAPSIMPFNKYQKIKAMQSFKQKFSEMTREYRDGFRPKISRPVYNMARSIKVEGKLQ